ncbi:hypothetical protein [Roseovarius aestuariivivens]|nr:hypothetical protein [Roseovarius aestuariivivens]
MQTAGFILLLAAGVIMLFGGPQPSAVDSPLSIAPRQAGLLVH